MVVLTGDTLFLANTTNLLLWQLYLGESSVLVTVSLFFSSQYLSSNLCDGVLSKSCGQHLERCGAQILSASFGAVFIYWTLMDFVHKNQNRGKQLVFSGSFSQLTDIKIFLE